MSKNNIDDIVKNSILQTSDTFTKVLIERIALRKRQAKRLQNAIICTTFLCAIFLFFITRMPLDLSLFKQHIKLPLLMVKVAGAIFVFIILNTLMSLKSKLD